MSRTEMTFHVNGEEQRVFVQPRRLLCDVLRDDCGLTGTHVGCEHGVCGACTVILDGRPIRSCLTYAVQVAGAAITTIEGVARDGKLSALQQALHEAHGLQCGFCTPGIILTMQAWLEENPAPTEHDIRDALSGNLCRCTGYHNIVAAVMKVAASQRKETAE